MNVAKLKKLKKWILDEPRRYNQATWIDTHPSSRYLRDQQPPCGTVACMAGNACLMEGYKQANPQSSDFDMVSPDGDNTEVEVEVAARMILDLSESQADKLFDPEASGWDKDARALYFESDLPNSRARAAAMAIDALIKKGRRRRATKAKRG